MSVLSDTSAATYTGNGVTTAYPVPFVYLDKGHVVVTRTIGESVQVLTLGAGYTLTPARAPSGGTVTLAAPLPTGATLKVERVVPLLQSAQLRTAGPFTAAGMEDALDLLVMGLQQEDRGLYSLRSRSTSLEDRAFSLEERATSLEGRADTLETLAAESAANGAALDGRATGLEELTSTFDARIGVIDVRSTSVESRFAAAESATVNLQGRADVLETRANTVEARATTVEGRATALETRATSLDARVTALEAASGTSYTKSQADSRFLRQDVSGTLTGNLTLSGAGNGLIFTDATKQTTAAVAIPLVFAKYSSTVSQSFSSNVTKVVDFATKAVDTDNAVTTGAAWTFTVPAAKGGRYLVSAAVTLNSGSNLTGLDLFVNGALTERGHALQAGTSFHMAKGTFVAQVVPGDALSIRLTCYGANVTSTTLSSENWVEIIRLSA